MSGTAMTAEQWARTKALFAELIELEAGLWDARLQQEPDAAIVSELRRLLQAHRQTDPFLNDGPAARARQAPDRWLGSRLGPFQIERLLGEGGSGRVYLAQREGVGGRVAVKLLHGHFLSDQASARFQSEQSILARLDHPGIARLLQVGVAEDGTPWLAMEHVDGQPLLQALAPLSLRERVRTFIQLLQAIDYAHRQLVVHRDIKPGNVLVDASGQPRLLDFGIAKRLDGQDPSLTRTQQQPRTPTHAAPEQILDEPVSVATDVYAVGVLLYEALSGCRPWPVSGRELETAILAGGAPLPSSRVSGPVRRQLRGDLDAIVLQAMQREPAQRYPSVAALAADLQRHLDHRPVTAQRQSWVYRSSRFLRRNHRWVAAAALLLGLLGVGLWRETRLRHAADLEAQKSAQVAAFMLDIFDAGDAQGQRFAIDRNSTVLDLMARADARLEGLQLAPLIRADLAHKMGQVYWGLSEYVDAERLFELALELRRGALGEHGETAGSLLMLARVYERTDRYPQMLEHAQAAYRIRLAELGPRHVDTLDALHRIGAAQYFLNEFEAAETTLQQAIAGWRQQAEPPPTQLGNSLTMLGFVDADRGRFQQALPNLREALALNRAGYPPGHPRLSEGLSNLATCLYDLGQFAEALELQREATQISVASFSTDHTNIVIDREWMARFHLALNQVDAAAEMSALGLAMASRMHQRSPNQALFDRARQMRVQVLRAQGALDEALALQREVLASREQQLSPSHRYVLDSRSVLADLLRRLDQPDAANQQLRQAIADWHRQPDSYSRQLIHAIDAFSSAGQCGALDGSWPDTMFPRMADVVAEARRRCALA
ncbi:MAG: serine/threonine-protein kinase [Lysobacterales bacterium]